MDTEHDPDSVTPPAEEEKAEQLEPWERLRLAAQELTRAANDLPPVTPSIVIPPFRMPRMPRLELTYDDSEPKNPPDPRHVIVSVLTVHGQRHDFSDVNGLIWQTYGPDEHNFSTERLLEIQNGDNEVIASYPAGTWLDVCYPAYRRPDPLKTTP
jgi:hypothetical protein